MGRGRSLFIKIEPFLIKMITLIHAPKVLIPPKTMTLTEMIESLPEELNCLVWEFDGRYKKAMDDSLAFFVSSNFRRSIPYYINKDNYPIWTEEYGNAAYNKEIEIRAEKYKKRMDFCTGHIVGITDQHRKPVIKRFRFNDIVGSYVIMCNKTNHIVQEIVYKGRAFRSVEKFPVLRTEPRPVRYNHYYDKIVEKCGIEVLDTKWLRKANRRKGAKDFIKQHMAI